MIELPQPIQPDRKGKQNWHIWHSARREMQVNMDLFMSSSLLVSTIGRRIWQRASIPLWQVQWKCVRWSGCCNATLVDPTDQRPVWANVNTFIGDRSGRQWVDIRVVICITTWRSSCITSSLDVHLTFIVLSQWHCKAIAVVKITCCPSSHRIRVEWSAFSANKSVSRILKGRQTDSTQHTFSPQSYYRPIETAWRRHQLTGVQFQDRSDSLPAAILKEQPYNWPLLERQRIENTVHSDLTTQIG